MSRPHSTLVALRLLRAHLRMIDRRPWYSKLVLGKRDPILRGSNGICGVLCRLLPTGAEAYDAAIVRQNALIACSQTGSGTFSVKNATYSEHGWISVWSPWTQVGRSRRKLLDDMIEFLERML